MVKEEVCRLCLCKTEITLQSAMKNKEQRHELYFKVKEIFCFEIQSDKGLPQFICTYCTERIISFYDYFRNVLENQLKLHKISVRENSEEENLTDFEEPMIDVKVEAIEGDSLFVLPFEEETNLKFDKRKVSKKIKKAKSETVPPIDSTVLRQEDERIARYISFKCTMCPSEDIKNFSEWKGHMRKVHNDRSGAITCCDKKLNDKKRILRHIEVLHEKAAECECHFCGKKFKRKPFLRSHMRTHNMLMDKNFQCENCPEKFLYHGQLIKHQLTHMTLEEQKLVQLHYCKECDKSFATVNNLRSHIRNVHKKLSTFVCHICAKVFNKKERLTAHVLNKHTINPPKHQCEHCGIKLATRDSRRRHIKVFHTNPGTFVCNICCKTFITEMQLKLHKRFTHETERKYACEHCPKAFKRPNELTEHLTIHLGGSLYRCVHCDRKFNSKSNMQSHVKKCKLNTNE